MFSRTDTDSFDFESGVFTAVSGRNVTVEVVGLDNGVVVGSESFRIRDNRETTKQLSDAIFDNVDEVQITASGGMILDDLVLVA